MLNKESQIIECKSNWHNDNLKVICAFANSNGGILYIGLNDNGKPSGLKNVKKLLEDIPNIIKNKLALNERQIKAVVYIKENKKITNKEYQRINDCSRNTATNDLRDLIKKHVLTESGIKGAGSFYVIAQ